MKTIHAMRGDGLGTRIATLMQAKVLADHLGWRLEVVWPPLGAPYYANPGLLARSDLDAVLAGPFFFGGEAPSGALAERIEEGGRRLAWASTVDPATMTAERLAAIASDFDGLVYDVPHPIVPDRDYGFSAEARVKTLWTEVNWSRSFRRTAEAWLRGIDRDAAVALHVRRGDIVTMLRQADLSYLAAQGMEQVLQRFTARASFSSALRGIDARRRRHVLVCGEETEGFLVPARDCPGSRVVATGRQAGTDTFRAFLDLYLMAEVHAVVAPFRSYFSGCATLVGRSRLLPVPLMVPDALAEIFAIIDEARRPDAVAVKALACAVCAQLLAKDSGALRVSYAAADAGGTA